MSESILDSVKKNLQLAPNYTPFDQDIILLINGVFSTLNQLGLGPDEGFFIEDNTTTWSDFIPMDPRFYSVRTYVYLKVKLNFDPPTTQFLLASIEKQVLELEYRLNTLAESQLVVVPPVVVPPVDGDYLTEADLQEHVNSDEPHPVYDDTWDIAQSTYQNAKV